MNNLSVSINNIAYLNNILQEQRNNFGKLQKNNKEYHTVLNNIFHYERVVDTLLLGLESDIWTVSSLSGADGAVLLTWRLEVRAFGVEISAKRDPRSIFRAEDVAGIEKTEINLDAFGMRHRSMIRLCAANPDIVGIVVSQDGSVRFMMGSRNNNQRYVMFWENPVLSIWRS